MGCPVLPLLHEDEMIMTQMEVGRLDKPKIMSLDLETYSDVDLGKCGLYRYVEGDFHILLLAYAFDDEDVQMVDLGMRRNRYHRLYWMLSMIRRL